MCQDGDDGTTLLQLKTISANPCGESKFHILQSPSFLVPQYKKILFSPDSQCLDCKTLGEYISDPTPSEKSIEQHMCDCYKQQLTFRPCQQSRVIALFTPVD